MVKVRDLFSKRNRVLLKEMVKTDFKLRYQGSILGHLWSILKPLALFFVMYMVFVRFLKFGAGVPHFAMSLLLAMVMWQFFMETISQGMGSIVARGDLLRKINFPKVIVVISASLGALINFGINLLVVLLFCLINGVQFEWYAIFAIFVFVELYVFSLGLALLFGALYVKFRDISHIWEIAAQAWMYMIPMIYPLSMVIAYSPTIAKLLLLDPLAQMIQDARTLLTYSGTGNETVWGYLHHWYFGIIPILITIAVFFIGVYYFNKQSQKFAEEV